MVLITRYWATLPAPPDDRTMLDRQVVAAGEVAAALGLLVESSPPVKVGQVKWDARFRGPEGDWVEFSTIKDWAPPGQAAGRTLVIKAPTSGKMHAAFSTRVAEMLGVRFRPVVHYSRDV